MKTTRTLLALLLLTALTAFAGCADLFGPGESPIERVEVTLEEPTIERFLTTQATALAYDASGQPLLGETFEWSARGDGTAVAYVEQDGTVEANLPGTSQIIATARDGTTGSATLEVLPARVVRIEYPFKSASLGKWIGSSAELYAANGEELFDYSDLRWESADSSILRVRADPDGMSMDGYSFCGDPYSRTNGCTMGVSAGETDLILSVDGITERFPIEVTDY